MGFDSTGIAGEQALSHRVQDAWAHFARAHSPSSTRSVFPVRRQSHLARSRPSHLALARCGTPVLRPFRSSGCSRSLIVHLQAFAAVAPARARLQADAPADGVPVEDVDVQRCAAMFAVWGYPA